MAGLTAGAGALLACDGPWADAVVRQGGAIQAARKAAGQAAEAGTLLRQALPILQRLGAPEATDVATELDALTSVPPAP